MNVSINDSSRDLVINGVTSSWGGMVLYMVLFVMLPLMITGIGLAVLWNLASYTRFKKYFEQFLGSFQYTLIGIVTCITLAIPMGVVYWGYMQAKAGNTVPFKYVVFIILGYIVLTTIGWFVNKYVIERIQKFEKELKGDGELNNNGQS